MSPNLYRLLADYQTYHRHPTNVLIHKLAVPVIVFHVLAMLNWIPLFAGITVAHLVAIAVVIWYFTLDVPLAIIMGLFFAALFPIANNTSVAVVLILTAVAWGIQLVGHKVYEKNSPAFFTNLKQLFVGPLFVGAVVTKRWPPKSPQA